MATKWKNNKRLGLLAILLAAMAASVGMCLAYPMYREKMADYRAQQQSSGAGSPEQETYELPEGFF